MPVPVTRTDSASIWSRLGRSYGAPAAIGLAAVLVEFGGEPLRLTLRFDREGLAALEIWRLVTGHLVHLGPSHMVMNVVALGVLAVILAGLLRAIDWVIIGLAAALAIDAGLYWISAGVGWYVGLSGVLHGFWAGATVFAIAMRRPEAYLLGLMLLIKLAYEFWVGPVSMTGEIAGGPVVTVAHAYGALGGAAAATFLFATRSRKRPI